MGWDTEATKRKLLDAGARQFAAHGFAGARMDAIGADAGVNKERVYQYFGNKRGLFDAALADRLSGLFEATDVIEPGPAGFGRCAGELFDGIAAAPEVARLLAWESLELDEAADAALRARSCAAKVDEVRAGLPGIDGASAQHLLLTVVTLVAGWWTLARVDEMIAPGADAADRRAWIVRQATALAGDALAAS